MPYLNRHEANVYYEFSGISGEWVTLINGHTRSIRDFNMMRKALNEAGFRVLTVENRGAGKTATKGPFHFQDMIDDILSVWTELGIKASSLVGISMGGVIAQMIAVQNPEKTSSLTLVSTAHDRKHIQSPGIDWGQTIESVTRRLSYFFSDQYLETNALLVNAMSKTILKQIEAGDFGEKSKLQSAAMRELEGESPLAKISCATLVVHGDKDKIIDATVAREMADKLQDSRLRIVSGAGHLLLAESPKTLYQDVIEFLNEKVKKMHSAT